MNKRKDAQKLAQHVLKQISGKIGGGVNEPAVNEKYIDALESSFGSLEIKSSSN